MNHTETEHSNDSEEKQEIKLGEKEVRLLKSIDHFSVRTFVKKEFHPLERRRFTPI